MTKINKMSNAVGQMTSNTALYFVFFSRELFLVAVHGWFGIQTNVWNVQNTTGRFLGQLHPSNYFLKSFSWCRKFPIHEFFRSDVL